MSGPLRLCISEPDNDVSVALFEGNEVRIALGEERLSRTKQQDGVPRLAIAEALSRASASFADLDAVCVVKPDPQREVAALDRSLALHRPFEGPLPPPVAALDYAALHLRKRRRSLATIARLDAELREFFTDAGVPRERIRRAYDHHHIHACSAYYGSGFEDALVVTADGQGAGVSATAYEVRGGRFRRLHEVRWPHSMGAFYASATKALGFKPNRHEGKITGLASYEPATEATLAFARSIARADGEGFTTHGVYGRYPELALLAKRSSPASIAAAYQTVLEEILVGYASRHIEAAGLSKIALAGGVFANVKLNQRISQIPAVSEVFVFPGMSDTGLSWGVGAYEAARTGEPPSRIEHVYLGPEYSDDEVAKCLRESGLAFEHVVDVPTVVGDLLADGHVVSRHGGRMEFGPRALGNRSCLFHARDPSVNDWLNACFHRTEFMPFAPVTLDEHAGAMYRGLDKGRRTARFMTMTFDCTDAMKTASPAAVHVDGTARPQLVDAAMNPTYHGILARYHARTGIPSIINTSFNMHEEPIVCTPADAVRAYVDAKVGVLSIGSFVVRAFETPNRAPHAISGRGSS